MSTFAASTCPREVFATRLPGRARYDVGASASIVTGPSGQCRTMHQSPVAGPAVVSAASASSTSAPKVARTGPLSVITVHRPLSTRATRPASDGAGSSSTLVWAALRQRLLPGLVPAEVAERHPRFCHATRVGALSRIQRRHFLSDGGWLRTCSGRGPPSRPGWSATAR